ncbi:hypothetical protein H8959_009669 [Pygathrix nigripes]
MLTSDDNPGASFQRPRRISLNSFASNLLESHTAELLGCFKTSCGQKLNRSIISTLFTYPSVSKRDDIGIILVNQYITEMVQHALDAHQCSIPVILEIPSKEHPYDATKESILGRARGMFSAKDLL